MKDKREFLRILDSIDGLDFSECSQLVGDFDFSRYILRFSRFEPGAVSGPMIFVVRVPQQIAGFPPHLSNTPVRRAALEDLLMRKFAEEIENMAAFDAYGVARRRISLAAFGQKILPRTTTIVSDDYVEIRLYMDIGTEQVKISSEVFREIFFEDLPELVNAALIHCNHDEREVEAAVDVMEDADQIRKTLGTKGLVSFIANGAMVSRISGMDYPDQSARPLMVADEHNETIETANAGTLDGLGIRTGITVVLGDSYSGREQLMSAISEGIYNHVLDDGREFCVTVPDAVRISEEPGRSIQRVDLSAFIDGDQMSSYSTDLADAYASQAAATVEALEAGARVLLFDESDSCAGFLGQDSRVERIMPDPVGTIIPLAAQARRLVDELGLSIIVGGSASVSAFIPIADTVYYIDEFTVHDVTEEAQKQGIPPATVRKEVDLLAMAERTRWVVPSSIDADAGRLDAVVDAPLKNLLEFGRSAVDLTGVTQLADVSQTRTIGLILEYARDRYMIESRPIREILDLVDRDLSTEGLDCLSRELRGDLARPRRYEIAAVLNRLDTLRITSAVE